MARGLGILKLEPVVPGSWLLMLCEANPLIISKSQGIHSASVVQLSRFIQLTYVVVGFAAKPEKSECGAGWGRREQMGTDRGSC